MTAMLMNVQVLTEQLDSLFAQTTASHISEVWVCVFSAPAQDYALRVVKESKYKNVRLVVSDFNFKFYGRFQVSQCEILGRLYKWSDNQRLRS